MVVVSIVAVVVNGGSVGPGSARRVAAPTSAARAHAQANRTVCLCFKRMIPPGSRAAS